MYYNWFRYYDPSTGRYITSDPIGLDGGLNTYNYVGSNAINYYDFYGLVPEGERGATGGSSGQGTSKPNKHCREFNPPDPRFVNCKHHQSGKWIKKPRPADMPFPNPTPIGPTEFRMPACEEDCQRATQTTMVMGVLILIMICLIPVGI